MRAATKVWLAAALLQRERGPQADFAKEEIAQRVEDAGWSDLAGPDTVRVHISSHCVASGRPSPARNRMLTRTSRGRYRLYRPGDPTHPARASGRILPEADDVPESWIDLLRWYDDEYLGHPRTGSGAIEGSCPEPAAHGTTSVPDPREQAMEEMIRMMRESGCWKGVNADEFVASLREGWDA